MTKLLKRLLFFLLFFSAQLTFCQGVFDGNPDIQAITVQNDTLAIKTFAFLEDKEYKHRNHLWYASYFRNQIIRTQGSHVGRLLHGKYQQFNADMRLAEEGNYIHGLQMGVWRYWKDGRLSKTVDWRTGRMQGQMQVFNNEGQLTIEANYKKGLLDGWYNTYENNELVAKVKYNKGEEVQIKEKEQDETKAKEESATIVEQVPRRDKTNQEVDDSSDTEQTKTRQRRTRRKTVTRASTQKQADDTDLMTTEEVNLENIQLFITDQSNSEALKQVAIKVSQFTRSANDERFRFFAYTDEDGYCQLLKDSADYVLFITHKGYEPHQLRIYEKDNRSSYHITLNVKKSCGELAGQVQPAAKNIALSGVKVFIKDERGRQVKTTYTDREGHFSVCLPCGERYTVNIQQEHYENVSEQVFLPPNCINLPQSIMAYLPSKDSRQDFQADEPPNTFLVKNSTGEEEIRPNTRENIIATTVAYQEEGAFKVIAGTFSKRSNANKRLAEVRYAGFSEAGIIQIKDSGYFAVCLGSLSSRDAAEALRNQFRSKTRLHAYVRDE